MKHVRLVEKLGKQGFHYDVKLLFEPLTDNIEKKTETSIKNNKTKENLIEKVLELMNDKSMIAPYVPFSLVNLCKPEHKSQFRLIKDFN